MQVLLPASATARPCSLACAANSSQLSPVPSKMRQCPPTHSGLRAGCLAQLGNPTGQQENVLRDVFAGRHNAESGQRIHRAPRVGGNPEVKSS